MVMDATVMRDVPLLGFQGNVTTAVGLVIPYSGHVQELVRLLRPDGLFRTLLDNHSMHLPGLLPNLDKCRSCCPEDADTSSGMENLM